MADIWRGRVDIAGRESGGAGSALGRAQYWVEYAEREAASAEVDAANAASLEWEDALRQGVITQEDFAAQVARRPTTAARAAEARAEVIRAIAALRAASE